MLSGFYTAGSGILNQQRNVNIIGNNISNNQTVGYKTQRMVQTTYEHNFLTRLENGVYHRIGEGDPAVYTEEVETLHDESYLKETENPYDMALVGKGYFNIAGNPIITLAMITGITFAELSLNGKNDCWAPYDEALLFEY